MKDLIFKGAAVAMVTPFKDNNEIDYEELNRLIDFNIENGTNAIVITGTTGESSTLSDEEHKKAIKLLYNFYYFYGGTVKIQPYPTCEFSHRQAGSFGKTSSSDIFRQTV